MMTNTFTNPESNSKITSSEIVQLIYDLQKTNLENIDTIQKLQQQLAEPTNHRKAPIIEGVVEYEEKLKQLEKDLEKERTSAESKSVAHAETLDALTKTRAENESLRASLKEYRETNDQLEGRLKKLEQTHKELRLTNSELEVSLKESESLVECVGNLTEEIQTLKTAHDYYKQGWEKEAKAVENEKDVIKYLKKEIACVSIEKKEATESLAMLQEEMKGLREAKAQAEHVSSNNTKRNSNEDKHKIEELMMTNDRLTKDLAQQSEAFTAVQQEFETLKADQTKIKETVVFLRQENYKLRHGGIVGEGSTVTPVHARPKDPPPMKKFPSARWQWRKINSRRIVRNLNQH